MGCFARTFFRMLLLAALFPLLSASCSAGAESYCDAVAMYGGGDGSAILSKDGKRSFLLLPVAEFPFFVEECVPSWCVKSPGGSPFVVLVRTGDSEGMNDWLLAGEWGCMADEGEVRAIIGESGVGGGFSGLFENGSAKVHDDYLTLSKRADRVQLMFAFAGDGGGFSSAALAVSSKRGDRKLRLYEKSPVGKPVSLSVPFRSQGWEDRRIAGHICSVVSTATVMDYYGVDVGTAELAALAYDPRRDMYGMWWRAVQSAAQYGFTGLVRHFRSLDDAREIIEGGSPVIACIAFGPNELAGSATEESEGHVVVVVGFDENGDVMCADGAFRKEEDGLLVYRRAEFERAWFINGGGIGYLIAPGP